MPLSKIQTNSLATGAVGTSQLATGAITSAIMPTGSVLQVVSQEHTGTGISTTSTSYEASGHLLSITPSSTSSKILVQLSGGHISYASTPDFLRVRFYRKIGSGSYSDQTGDLLSCRPSSSYGMHMSAIYFDSPATTSEVTYQVYIRSGNGNVVHYNQTLDLQVQLTLMEIAG